MQNKDNRLNELLKSSEVFFTLKHVRLTEEEVEVVNKTVDFVTDEGKVQGLKLSENLSGKNVVKTVKLSTAAAYESRNVLTKLLNNTVTECKSEVLDNIVVKQFNLVQVLF